MANLALWNLVSELKSEKYKWVDLTHELSPETPHWYGFNPLEAKLLFDYVEGTPEDMMAPMRCFQVSVASQYGTHVDVPRHFWGEGRSMESIDVTEMVMPLVVVDKSKECAANPDFMLTIDDLKAWEAEYGQIPAGSFVAFRSDWHKKGTNLDNPDENGVPHYPGWDVEAIRWLVDHQARRLSLSRRAVHPGGKPFPDRGHAQPGSVPCRGCYDRVRFPQAERRRRFPRPLLCHLPRRINLMSNVIKV